MTHGEVWGQARSPTPTQSASHQWLNTLRPRQNGRHFADDTFSRIFVNKNVRISIEFSLKFVPKGPINNIPALVQIMAWRRPGDKPLSGPMLVRSLTHICVTRQTKFTLKQLQVIWYSVINSIIHWGGWVARLGWKVLLFVTKVLVLDLYLNGKVLDVFQVLWVLELVLACANMKSTCTWLKYFENYLLSRELCHWRAVVGSIITTD